MVKKIYMSTALLCILLISSCAKWLDVQPEDKLTEDQIYSTAQGIAEAMNGLYLKMGSNSLYGQNLTLDKLDLFAHRYNAFATNAKYYNYIHHTYTDVAVKGSIEEIWKGLYDLIANANQFVSNIKKHRGVLTEIQEKQYLGEAIAIRSLAYFDLLRLFGPVYALNPQAASIPYYQSTTANAGAFLPGNEVLRYILRDLDESISYLQNDGIVTQNGIDNYNNYRLNLYAAMALKARALLWSGTTQDKSKALNLAKQVIAVAVKFPWVTHLAVTGNPADADRIFSTEILFGIFNSKLYSLQNSLFSASLTDLSILATGTINYVDHIYEGNQGDYRYIYSWPFPSGGSVMFRTFIKYQDMASKDLTRRFTIPLIRLTEVYYIAAECETDPAQALNYLNTVRQKRNITLNLDSNAELQSELTKEYLKEFYGEGQLWYYYKRKVMRSISSPNTISGNGSYAMNPDEYVLPIPDSELSSR